MVLGFVTGGLARLAVPGPDPMPVWLTVGIGLAGSWGGGAIAAAIWGWNATTAVSFVGGYRRVVQKRPITGPDAFKFPERGFGIDRFRQRRQKLEDLARQQQQLRAQGDSVTDQLRKLAELRDA